MQRQRYRPPRPQGHAGPRPQGRHRSRAQISRLARNTADLLALVKQLTEKGVAVTFQKEGLTFTGDKTNSMNQMLLTMLGAVSAFELSMINERRAEGQAKAREAGKHMGRLSEHVGLKYSKIKWKYTQQKIGGGSGGNTAGSWDLAANKKA